MENLLGSLRKENKEREKRLIIGDRRLIADMVGYIKTKKVCDYDTELIRKKIIRNALRAYGNKKRNFQDMVGEDYRIYCDKLCEGSRQMTTKEFILSRGVTLILAFAMMYFARLVDVVVTGGNFLKNPVDINLGYVTATAALMVGIGATYLYVAKILRGKGRQLTGSETFGMLGILLAIMVVAAAGGTFLAPIHLFYVTWWIPVVIIAALYGVFKVLYVQYENELAKDA